MPFWVPVDPTNCLGVKNLQNFALTDEIPVKKTVQNVLMKGQLITVTVLSIVDIFSSLQ
jgi:hypothetical protein